MFNPHESLTEAVCSMEFQISNMIQKKKISKLEKTSRYTFVIAGIKLEVFTYVRCLPMKHILNP